MNAQTISPLHQATEAAFKTAWFDHGHGLFSPRSGLQHQRGTGYVVNTGPSFVIDTTVGRGHSFLELVQYVLANRLELESSLPEPRYINVVGAEGKIGISIAIIVNDYREALHLARSYGQTSVYDNALQTVHRVEYPSKAAVEFAQEYFARNHWDDEGSDHWLDDPQEPVEAFADIIAEVVSEEYEEAPDGKVYLHDLPGLQENPWNKPYIRSHVC
jgi:hypothetical protein